ncbi:MAG TPA: DUF2017 family protein, partial [Mycobacteriales bacterium]|nr:DUF2017 family protein [Mycobacteriales bacterium]
MGSVRRQGDLVQVSLDRVEAGLLASLIGQTEVLLDDPEQSEDPLEQAFGVASEAPAAPDDPVLLRLLPDGYREDSDAAAEFRRLTEADLRATKRVALHRMLETLDAAAG